MNKTTTISETKNEGTISKTYWILPTIRDVIVKQQNTDWTSKRWTGKKFEAFHQTECFLTHVVTSVYPRRLSRTTEVIKWIIFNTYSAYLPEKRYHVMLCIILKLFCALSAQIWAHFFVMHVMQCGIISTLQARTVQPSDLTFCLTPTSPSTTLILSPFTVSNIFSLVCDHGGVWVQNVSSFSLFAIRSSWISSLLPLLHSIALS